MVAHVAFKCTVPKIVSKIWTLSSLASGESNGIQRAMKISVSLLDTNDNGIMTDVRFVSLGSNQCQWCSWYWNFCTRNWTAWEMTCSFPHYKVPNSVCNHYTKHLYDPEVRLSQHFSLFVTQLSAMDKWPLLLMVLHPGSYVQAPLAVWVSLQAWNGEKQILADVHHVRIFVKGIGHAGNWTAVCYHYTKCLCDLEARLYQQLRLYMMVLEVVLAIGDICW